MTKSLGIDNNLVFAIDSCYAVIALNHAFTGRHLGGFVIGDITFDFFLSFALTDFWLLCCEKFVNAIGCFIQSLGFLQESSRALFTIAGTLVCCSVFLYAPLDLSSDFIALFL